MIQNSSLKQAILSKFVSVNNMTDYEKIATEIIFYKYLCSLINNSGVNSNDPVALADYYVQNFLNKFIELKDKYSGYLNIINYLEKINAKSFMTIAEDDINYVYNLYLNSKEILEFSISNFSPEIYLVDNLSTLEYKYLKHIHFDVMAPIARYYCKLYGVAESDMKIIDSNSEQLNTGKKIEFYISGIQPSTIYSDIINKKIPISYYKLNFKYPNIEIINS